MSLNKAQLSALTDSTIYENTSELITATNVNVLIKDIIDALALESELTGSTMVAGLDTQVQFNDGGFFGADSGFTYDKSGKNLMVGTDINQTIIGSSQSVIIGSDCSNILSANTSTIIGSRNVYMNETSESMIGGTSNALISYSSENAALIGSQYSQIYRSNQSSIIGAKHSSIKDSNRSVIIGGEYMFLSGVSDTVLVSGLGLRNINTTTGATVNLEMDYTGQVVYSTGSTRPGGSNMDIQFNDNGDFGGVPEFTYDKDLKNFIVGSGLYESIRSGSTQSAIIASDCANIQSSNTGAIIGSRNVYLNEVTESMIGGTSNALIEYSSENSALLGSQYVQIYRSNQSAIIGAKNSHIKDSNRSVIIGGQYMFLSGVSDTVLVSGLQLANTPTTTAATVDLKMDYFGKVVYEFPQSGTSFAGGINQSVQFNDNGDFGGTTGFTYDKNATNFITGNNNQLTNSYGSTIIGGGFSGQTAPFYGSNFSGHTMDGNINSVIIGGGVLDIYGYVLNFGGQMSGSNSSSIITSVATGIADSQASSILAQTSGGIFSSQTSVMIGGNDSQVILSQSSIIVGSNGSSIYDGDSTVILGTNNGNIAHSDNSSVISSQYSSISASTRSAIIGGHDLSLNTESDTVFVPNLKVNANISVNSGGTFSNGITGVYTIGLNIFTVVNGIITNIS